MQEEGKIKKNAKVGATEQVVGKFVTVLAFHLCVYN